MGRRHEFSAGLLTALNQMITFFLFPPSSKPKTGDLVSGNGAPEDGESVHLVEQAEGGWVSHKHKAIE